MAIAIVWFKNNLRLTDHGALTKAIAAGYEILPVYCFNKEHFTTTKFGFKKTGVFRVQFLIESLTDLDQNLRALQSGLITTFGNPAIDLANLALQYNAKAVFTNSEIATEELNTLKTVQIALQQINCSLHLVPDGGLYDIEKLPFNIVDLPNVFTHFRKTLESSVAVPVPLAKPSSISSPVIAPLVLPTLAELGLSAIEADHRGVLNFKGGETAALQRLHHYFEETHAIASYKETRNGLVGADYSSKFSAWLAMGCISARTIVAELKGYEKAFTANESTYWLFFELLWREYFRLVMIKYKQLLFLPRGIKAKQAPSATLNEKVLQQWIDGKTGVDFIDANMLELKLTGFMSNRGRQNVASYLINDLKQDWRYGAAYFEQQLIDYDVHSNWGNWAYLAGVGNDPRSNRYFNIRKQANDYDKDEKFRKLWLKK
eukprot:GDKJ01048288.1.p1 GENE.GDKJ01048288.1~~GDKJ01048288.1.p1  ORF type:complete len:431 (-),score=13.63 GDKJ01048288.1:1414-2706(-)